MIIQWYGGNCYKIATPDFAIIVDPEAGASGNRIKGDLIIKTNSLLAETLNNKEDNVIGGPGEYEFSGVKIRGQKGAESKDNLLTAYKVIFEDIKMGFIPTLVDFLSENALDVLSDVDILFVPASDEGVRITKKTEPKIVVLGEGEQKKTANDLGKISEPEEKLVIKKKEIEALTGLKVVILNK